MKKRKQKRTAGQRRYLALRKQIIRTRDDLKNLQISMQNADQRTPPQQLRGMHVMQEVTEAVERLSAAIVEA